MAIASSISVSCCLVIHPYKNDLILGVTRREYSNNWVLPGGYCSGSETVLDNAVRKTLEKTGVLVYPQIKPLYIGANAQNFALACATYLVEDYDGNLKHNPDREVEWVHWNKIIAGTFGQYVYEVQKAYISRNWKDI